jgi:aspartate aminotransferase-like enzyme
MFGPNTHLNTEVSVRESHRDASSKTLIRAFRDTFTEKFALHDFDIVFLVGGGSLGVESLVYSSRNPVRVVGVDGDFTSRWQDLGTIHNRSKSRPESDLEQQLLYCQLETSVSAFQYFGDGFVDSVASFPYVRIPDDTRAFVTSSNKILGSFVGLTIVGVRKNLRSSLLNEADASYLSLARYFKYMDFDQTPSTTSIHNVRHLLNVIQETDYAKVCRKIDVVSDLLSETVGAEYIIGATRSPVLTIQAQRIPISIAEKWDLYRKPRHDGVYQLFTYSCQLSEYEQFCEEFSKHLRGR